MPHTTKRNRRKKKRGIHYSEKIRMIIEACRSKKLDWDLYRQTLRVVDNDTVRVESMWTYSNDPKWNERERKDATFTITTDGSCKLGALSWTGHWSSPKQLEELLLTMRDCLHDIRHRDFMLSCPY